MISIVFKCCENLEQVSIPNTVKRIECAAFRGCTKLTRVEIPGSVKELVRWVFAECTALTEVRLNDGTRFIGEGAFESCTNLRDIYIPDSVENIFYDAFWGCEKLTIHAHKGSYAEEYAKENNISFVATEKDNREELDMTTEQKKEALLQALGKTWETSISLIEQQRIMLDILREVVAYFEKHNLNYSLAFGTLLGAVRHGGFIPWDDDVDLMMPMEDYCKFIELAEKEPVSEDVFVSVPLQNPGHTWPIVKVVSKKTALVEPVFLKKYQRLQEPFCGVYIDIFPVYGIPDDKASQKKYLQKVYSTYIAMCRAGRCVPNFPGAKGFVKKTVYNLCFVPYRMLGLKHYIKKLIDLTEKYPFDTTQTAAYGMGFVGLMRDIALTEEIKETSFMKFEDVECRVPTAYDAILKRLYGDYMKLPPESERKIHPREVYYR